MRPNKLLPAIVMFLLVPIIMPAVFAIPNSLTLQGKLTSAAGASQQGTFNFTFAIYDSASSGNKLWEKSNLSVVTDANGVYDVMLNGINLSFAEQYYLGITLMTDNESVPRINLTASPYSFRSNVSDGLNANNTYAAKNLNATESFAANNTLFVNASRVGIGTIAPYADLVVIGSVGISGSLNASSINTTGSAYFATGSGMVGIGTASPSEILTVIGNVNISGYLNISGDFVVNNKFNVTAGSGNVNVAGVLDAANLRILGSNVQVEANAFKISNYSSEYAGTGFKIGNYSSEYASTGYKLSNFTSNYDARADRYSITNYSAEYASTGYKLANFTSNLNSINASISLWNGTGNIYPRDITGNVGIGTTAPSSALQVAGTANITSGSTQVLVDATGDVTVNLKG